MNARLQRLRQASPARNPRVANKVIFPEISKPIYKLFTPLSVEKNLLSSYFSEVLSALVLASWSSLAYFYLTRVSPLSELHSPSLI